MSLMKQLSLVQARVAELEDTLATSQTELAEAMKEMDKMKKKVMMEKRKARTCRSWYQRRRRGRISCKL